MASHGTDDTRGIVEQVLMSPEFQRELNNAVAACTASQNTNITAINSRNISLHSRNQSTSAAEEMQRLFPTLRSINTPGRNVNREVSRPSTTRFSKRSKPYKKAYTTFTKNVFLQPDHLSTNTYKGAKQASAMSSGKAFLGVKFEKCWSDIDIKDHIRTLFKDKLQQVDFELMVPIAGKLTKPPVPPNQPIDGSTVSAVFQSRPIYIRPKQSLLQYEEMCESSNEEVGQLGSNGGTTYNTTAEPLVNNSSTEEDLEIASFSEEAIQLAVERSLEGVIEGNMPPESASVSAQISTITAANVISDLCKKIDHTISCKFNIIREEVFDSAVRAMRRKTFDPCKNVSVKFTDKDNLAEGAVDEGGPRRELWRLLLLAIEEKFFEGEAHRKLLKVDSAALQEGMYFEVGRTMAMSLTHGGSGPQFLSDGMFTWITKGPNVCEATVAEIYDQDVVGQINNISAASDLAELQTAIEKHYSLLLFCGVSPYCRDLAARNAITASIIRFYVIDRRRAVMEQFLSGLETLNVLQSIREHPKLFCSLLCYKGEELTASVFEELFPAQRSSEEGSNHFTIEARVIGYWRDFLQDIEDGEADVTFPQFLAFATGASTIPPLGFHPPPKLEFLHDDASRFPKANTCGMVIKLPVTHSNYNFFKTDMQEGVISSASQFGYA